MYYQLLYLQYTGNEDSGVRNGTKIAFENASGNTVFQFGT